MVGWRQTSGFQATLLLLVPSGGEGGWGSCKSARLNGILARTIATYAAKQRFRKGVGSVDNANKKKKGVLFQCAPERSGQVLSSGD